MKRPTPATVAVEPLTDRERHNAECDVEQGFFPTLAAAEEFRLTVREEGPYGPAYTAYLARRMA